jgi:cholesterol transport system auxiliary component
MRPLLRTLLMAAAMAVLAGCFSGLNSNALPAQRYVLQAPVAAEAATAIAAAPLQADASLVVLRPNAAPGLVGDGIAVLRPGARLDFYSNARWAADAPAALQSLVIASLRAAGRFATVEPDSGPFATNYLLSLDLEHFEASYGDDGGAPTVQVALVASLGRRSDRSVILSFTARSAIRAEADHMQAVVAAFQQATAQVLSQLAANIAPPAGP